MQSHDIVAWCFEHITSPQLEEMQQVVQKDTAKRREYLDTAFTQVILDAQTQIQEWQTKVLMGDTKVQEKIAKKEERIRELLTKKQARLTGLDLLSQLSPKAPEVLGCAYVVPLTQVEYKSHYGMSRDDEAEAIAMQTAMDYEMCLPVNISLVCPALSSLTK